ncbi:hypothetical protein HK097_008396, partial [Rhizophlyctis rosea]
MTTESLSRPTLLITDAYNTQNLTPTTRKDRDAQLIDLLTSAIRNQQTLLIPIDSTTRVLELSYILEQHWQQNRIQYPLVLVGNQSARTAVLARSMLEWMGEGVEKQFGMRREVPFDF